MRYVGEKGSREGGAVLAQRRAQQRVRPHLEQHRIVGDGHRRLSEAYAVEVAVHLQHMNRVDSVQEAVLRALPFLYNRVVR